jgi:hypothetical protein
MLAEERPAAMRWIERPEPDEPGDLAYGAETWIRSSKKKPVDSCVASHQPGLLLAEPRRWRDPGRG